MNHILHIKNMVCNRCKMTIINLLDDEGYEVESIQLGKIVVKEQSSNDYARLETQLNALGFEVIKDSTKALCFVERFAIIQNYWMTWVWHHPKRKAFLKKLMNYVTIKTK